MKLTKGGKLTIERTIGNPKKSISFTNLWVIIWRASRVNKSVGKRRKRKDVWNSFETKRENQESEIIVTLADIQGR
jgi:hypothetical protein